MQSKLHQHAVANVGATVLLVKSSYYLQNRAAIVTACGCDFVLMRQQVNSA